MEPVPRRRRRRRGPAAYVRGQVDRWRSGSRDSQVFVLLLLLAGVAGSFAVGWHAYDLVPLTSYFLWLLLGMLLLRFRPLALLTAAVLVAAPTVMLHDGPLSGPRGAALATLVASCALILYQSSRQRSGLPVPLSEALLVDLRDRLRSQGSVPPLPPGWRSQSAMLAAGGGFYAGDFLVADLRGGRHLEMVLVDVCGKGITAGPQALQLGGALGGLIGALPPRALMRAVNAFLLRQGSEESFSTAVHLLVDLETGRYSVLSAGHPPALRWRASDRVWEVDNARGTALGVVADPQLDGTVGLLEPGDALMFYTDGVVESRGSDVDTGIAWLCRVATEAVVTGGLEGTARRVIEQVEAGDDDRAVLILERAPAGDPVTPASTAAG